MMPVFVSRMPCSINREKEPCRAAATRLLLEDGAGATARSPLAAGAVRDRRRSERALAEAEPDAGQRRPEKPAAGDTATAVPHGPAMPLVAVPALPAALPAVAG